MSSYSVYAERRYDCKPDKHYGTERSPNFRSTERLHYKECEEDRD
jgi:hypothetical protein